MRLSNFFNHLLGVVLICVSIFSLIIFAIVNLIFDEFIIHHYILFSVFCLSPFLLGVLTIIWARKERSQERMYDFEVDVLKYAASVNHGKITVSEVSMRFRQPVYKAEELLRELQGRGIFEVQVSDEGVLVYKLNRASDKGKEQAGSII